MAELQQIVEVYRKVVSECITKVVLFCSALCSSQQLCASLELFKLHE